MSSDDVIRGRMARHEGGPELRAFEVHTETLDAAARTLDSLADFALNRVLVDLDASLNLGVGEGSKSSTVFGTFSASQKAADKHNGYYQTAFASTQILIKSLRDTAELTRKFARNYRDAEAASKANMDDVNRILEGGGSTAPTQYGGAGARSVSQGNPAQPSGSGTVDASYRPESSGAQEGSF